MYTIGQQVRIDSHKFPGVYRIIKINAVNIKVESVDNPQRRVNVNPMFLLDANADTGITPEPIKHTYIHFVLGAVVKVRGRSEKYVVIGTSGANKTRVAKLGGDGDRYLSCPNQMLAVWDDSKV